MKPLKFKVGDRVIYYTLDEQVGPARYIGKIKELNANGSIFIEYYDPAYGDDIVLNAHPKQLRRLKPKKKELIYANNSHCPVCTQKLGFSPTTGTTMEGKIYFIHCDCTDDLNRERKTSDAVQILHKRYITTPEREASLEAERKKPEAPEEVWVNWYGSKYTRNMAYDSKLLADGCAEFGRIACIKYRRVSEGNE